MQKTVPRAGFRLGWNAPIIRALKALIILALSLSVLPTSALAHAVAEGDKGYIQEITGVHFIPFMYLGAKHMMTGYDHLLFLAGVIFFLYRLNHIAIYVTLFAIGYPAGRCCHRRRCRYRHLLRGGG